MGAGNSKIHKHKNASATTPIEGEDARYRCVECKVAPVRLRKRLCEDCIPVSDPRELPARMGTLRLSRAASGLARTSTSLSEFFSRGKRTASSAPGVDDPNSVPTVTGGSAAEPTNHGEQHGRTTRQVRSRSIIRLSCVDG
jgi:hypothetical protein